MGVVQLSFSQAKDNEDYSFKLTRVFNGKIAFGGHKDKFGPSKKESEVLYRMEVDLKIQGLEKEKVLDFNYFSIVDHTNKSRHPVSWVMISATFGGSYYVEKLKTTEYPDLIDTFSLYSQEGIKDYDKYRLEANALSMVTNKSKSYKYLFGRVVPNKMLLRTKKVKLYFYTKVKKIGTFSIYYKDKLIETFTTTKKSTLTFK